MKKQLFLLLAFISFYTLSLAQTNSWDGSFNTYWHNDNNWSLGHIPLSTEDVVITTAGNTCHVDFYDETCNSLTVNSGATLYIADQKLTVNGNVNIYGSLEMTNTAAKLYCVSVYWRSGSTANMTASSTIYVTGNWEFVSGANVYLTSGYVNFYGSGNSFIRSKDSDSYFNHIRNYKSSGYLGHSGQSTYPLDINGNIYCYSNTTLSSNSSQHIELAGFLNNISGHIYLGNGTFKFDGGTTTSQFMAGDYFNNVTIQSTGTTNFDDNIEVKGTLRIESGIFDPNENTITVGGNWENVAGVTAFYEVNSLVIFNGSDQQYCNYNENFNNLEINKTAGALRVNSSTAELYCANYNWTSGAIDILQGTFTADDLADSGIQGSWYLNDGGEINLTKSSGYVDLYGDLHIFGGDMNVHGGQDDSYWPYDSDASIEMSGGSLKFHDVGINIRNVGNLTENITNGWIRTTGNIRIDRTDFTPSGGIIAMLGLTDTYVRIDNGWIYQLDIDKSTSKSFNNNLISKNESSTEIEEEGIQPISLNPELYNNSNSEQKGIYLTGFTSRDGTSYLPSKSNTVTAYDDIYIGNMAVYGGTFDPDGHFIDMVGDMAIANTGNLKMTNVADHINLRDIWWYPSSTANMTNGLMEVRSTWRFENGTNCEIGPGNIISFEYEAEINGIHCYDADAHFGSVIINDYIYINGGNTESVKITGDLAVTSGYTLNTQGETVVVDGTIDINNGGAIQMYQAGDGGFLINNSDFILNGVLDVGNGDVTVHGEFDIASTGELTIDGGSFIYDESIGSSDIYGTLSISDGLFQSAENIWIRSSATTNITGGIIRSSAFRALYAGTFQPTGGTVEIQTNNNSFGWIICSNGNYFHNLEMNPINATTGGGGVLHSDITVQNNLEVTAGSLWFDSYEATVNNNVNIHGGLEMNNSSDVLNVGNNIFWKTGSTDDISLGTINVNSDWWFEDGTSASLPAANTVNFVGSGTSLIYCMDADAEFGNVTINKTYASFNAVEILENTTIMLSGDLNIIDGCIELNSYTDIDVDGDITISDNAGLNANDTYVDIHIGGDWSNMNNNYDIAYGFNPGFSSTVTFDGDLHQHISTAAPQEDFFNLEINKSNKLKSNDDTQVYGDFTIINGEWLDENNFLTHKYWGDIVVEAGAHKDYQLGASDYLLGSGDQTITNFGFIDFFYLIVDKTATKDQNINIPDDEGNTILYIPGKSKDSKSQTVTISGNSIYPVDLIVEEGILDVNTTGIVCSGTIEINDNGKITVGPDGSLYTGWGGITINSNGELQMNGLDGQEALYQCWDIIETPIIVNSGGTIGAEYTDFRRVNITINSGASINPLYTFNNCSFEGRDTGSTLLTINNNQTLTIDNAYFPTNTWGGTYNVAKTLNQGQVTFTNVDPTSGFAGEDYENDSYNRINWPDVVKGRWTGLVSNIWNNTGNWEYNLKPGSTDDVYIPSSAPNMPWVSSTDQECNNVIIEAGASLRIYDEILTVHGDMEINGQLRMDHASGTLNIGNDIYWENGSSDNISLGTIIINGDWWFRDGTSASLAAANTVNFAGSGSSLIYCMDADAEFGSVGVNKSNLATWIHSTSTQAMQVTGSMTVYPGDIFQVQNNELVVDGILDIQNTAGLYLGTTGSLTNNSDFNLNGSLDVGLGDCQVHGEFDIETTGELTIDGGSFISDEGVSAVPFNIRGTFNMSGGLFQAGEWFGVDQTASITISGGLIRSTSFIAPYAGTFQPTAGTVEIQANNGGFGYIICSNGNYFRNLSINSTSGGGVLNSNVIVQNNLEITAGGLWFDSYEATVNNDVNIYGGLLMINSLDVLNVGNDISWNSGSLNNITNGTINVNGDWVFENGASVQLGTGNTVNFYGNNNSTINNYDAGAEFGNLSINKTSATNNIVEIPVGTTIRVAEDLDIDDGEFKMNENTELFVQNKLNVNSGGTLSVIGTSGNESRVSGFPGYCDLDVANGGTISAEYTTFEYFEGSGIYVAPGATIDPAHPFNHCTFTEGSTNGVLLTINNSQTLTIDGANFPNNTWGGLYNVSKTANNGQIIFTDFTGDFTGSEFDYDPNNRIFWHNEDYFVNVRLYLEGPYNQTAQLMEQGLNNSGLVPLTQPYNTSPWNYPGTETVTSVPPLAVDWVLVELRDAPDAASAASGTIIARQAAFINNNGFIVSLDGSSFPLFNTTPYDNLFVVIWHRNHLGIMSAYPLVESGGVYDFDFSTDITQVYNGSLGYKEIVSGVFGMAGGDANADGDINATDKTFWTNDVGIKGYKAADFNMDVQVDNQDKNDTYIENGSYSTQVPD